MIKFREKTRKKWQKSKKKQTKLWGFPEKRLSLRNFRTIFQQSLRDSDPLLAGHIGHRYRAVLFPRAWCTSEPRGKIDTALKTQLGRNRKIQLSPLHVHHLSDGSPILDAQTSWFPLPQVCVISACFRQCCFQQGSEGPVRGVRPPSRHLTDILLWIAKAHWV